MDTQSATDHNQGDSEGQEARKFQADRLEPRKTEMRLVKKAFAEIPKAHHVLDMPCGGGFVTLHLARKGYWMSAADLSEPMLEVARNYFADNKLECALEQQDVRRLTYADKTFDTVFCFRYFSHLPTPLARQRVVSEMCRVAKKYVVISYMSAASVTNVKRRLQVAMGGKKPSKYATSLAEIKGYFEHAGFELVKDFARAPFVHTLHVAVFERVNNS